MKKIVILLLLVAFGCSRETTIMPKIRRAKLKKPAPTAPAEASADVGGTMPPFQATSLDGKPFDLTAERTRHVIFLNVWATWCGPCRFEIPELEKLHAKYASRGFEVVGVSVDEGGADAVKGFVAEQKISYPIVLDPPGRIANLLQTTVLPTSVVIDRNGKIVWRRIGALMGEDASLNAAIEQALK